MIQARWRNVFYFYSLKFKRFIVVKRTYTKATATIQNTFLILFQVKLCSQHNLKEGISSSRSQNSYYVFVDLVLTCYNGTYKMCVLEDNVEFAFGFDLSLKHYFVTCCILLIFCVLLDSFLLCLLFSDASTAFSCWEVGCHAGLCSRLKVKSSSFRWLLHEIDDLVCSRCKLLPPSVHKAVYKLPSTCIMFKGRGEGFCSGFKEMILAGLELPKTVQHSVCVDFCVYF